MTGIEGFILLPRVKVRKEGFGLLFYNGRNTNLTFVKCGDLLNFNEESGRICRTKADLNVDEEEKVKRIFKDLLRRGLVANCGSGEAL